LEWALGSGHASYLPVHFEASLVIAQKRFDLVGRFPQEA
jgi:hypothetical protein